MSKSDILLFFCLSFIGGIAFASFRNKLYYQHLGLLLCLIAFFIFIFLVLRKWKCLLVTVGCLVFLFGIVRYQVFYVRVHQNQLTGFANQKIDLIGEVVSEPILKNNKLNFTILPLRVKTTGGRIVLLRSNKILIVTRFISDYRYGDIVKVDGKLEIPSIFDDFNYRMFLAKDGINFIFYYPQVSLIGKKHFILNLYPLIFTVRERIRGYISRYFPSEQALLLRSIIVGDKDYLTPELKNKLNIAGIRHIVAISGMHIVIIESVLMVLLLDIGLWRNQALYLTLFFSLIFIAITGFQVSAIRAWIMGSFYIFFTLLGGKGDSFRILVLTAVIMLLFNPLILRYDVSFQLSFLAVLGIIYLNNFFRYWLKFIPNEKFIGLRNILSMTLSAQLMTFPLLIYYFKHISLIAPLGNILIIPTIPFLIFFGLFFSFFSFLSPTLGFIFIFPSYFFLSYIIWVINFLARFSFYIKMDISPFCIIIFYIGLSLFLWGMKKEERTRFLDY